ncbi:MAG: metal ABC transporter permease [Candidatus Methanospirareceae archaeon]
MIEILQYEFMRNAFIAAFLGSIACGIVGVYVVVKRIVFISGGIAHAAFGGVGIGYFLGMESNPMPYVLPFTVLSAILMRITCKRAKIAEDTAIGILWVIGMSLGVILVNLTPEYTINPFDYLFGNILLVSKMDIILMGVLDVVIVVFVILLYKELQAISFDEEYATTLGLPTEGLYLLLLCLVALSVVILMRVVGIILVIAMLTIPAAMSKQFTNRMSSMMLLSTVFCLIFIMGGMCIAYVFDLPTGATIVLFSTFVFLFSAVMNYHRLRKKSSPVL